MWLDKPEEPTFAQAIAYSVASFLPDYRKDANGKPLSVDGFTTWLREHGWTGILTQGVEDCCRIVGIKIISRD